MNILFKKIVFEKDMFSKRVKIAPYYSNIIETTEFASSVNSSSFVYGEVF